MMEARDNRKPVTDELVKRAIELRRMGVYTMREIAERLGADRDALIEAIENAGGKQT